MKTFYPDELVSFAEKAGYSVILCEKGEIYKPEDGTILYYLCRNTSNQEIWEVT